MPNSYKLKVYLNDDNVRYMILTDTIQIWGHVMYNRNKPNILKLSYEIVITILALIAVVMASLDIIGKVSIESTQYLHIIDISILIIFTIDYAARFFVSKDKKKFFKDNIFDLIAIIPFNSLFRAFRITRFFRITRLANLTKISRGVRLIAFSKKFYSKIKVFLYTNGFIYILFLTVLVTFFGAIGIYYTEGGETIHSFGDAIWWSYVTATTVGYGDISPKTSLGRLIAGILMITGIGFIGMLTGTIATFFLNRIKKEESKNLPKDKIVNLSEFSDMQYKEIMDFINFIKSKGE